MVGEVSRRILVYGGRGALGNACVKLFSKHGYVSAIFLYFFALKLVQVFKFVEFAFTADRE